jgi:hypothetical protein
MPIGVLKTPAQKVTNNKNKNTSKVEGCLSRKMRVSHLKNKTQTAFDRVKNQTMAFEKLIHEINYGDTVLVLKRLLSVYKARMHKYIKDDIDVKNYTLYTTIMNDKCYVILQDVNKEKIIFCCGPLGYIEPTMYCYCNEHVQTRIYQFWVDADLMKLLITPLSIITDEPLVNWKGLNGDVLRYMTNNFGCKDLLSCTRVCKNWRYHLLKDSVWKKRVDCEAVPLPPAGSEVPHYFLWFIKTNCLLSTFKGPMFIEQVFVKDVDFGLVLQE